jgi:hypothetical protein
MEEIDVPTKKDLFDDTPIVKCFYNGIEIGKIIMIACCELDWSDKVKEYNYRSLGKIDVNGCLLSYDYIPKECKHHSLEIFDMNGDSLNYDEPIVLSIDEIIQKNYLPYVYYECYCSSYYSENCKLAKMVGKKKMIYYDD